MALWHYKSYLVPLPTKDLTKEEFELEDGWEINCDWSWERCGEEVIDCCNKWFSPVESWSESILMFGEADDRLEISIDKKSGVVEDVRIKANLTEDNFKSFIFEDIIELCEISQVKVLDAYSGRMFSANVENFRKSVINSNAARFLNNPDEYFQSIKT